MRPRPIRAVALGKAHRARVFINDYWQLTLKHRAYGMAFGEQDIDNADLAAINKAGLRPRLSTKLYCHWRDLPNHTLPWLAQLPKPTTTAK